MFCTYFPMLMNKTSNEQKTQTNERTNWANDCVQTDSPKFNQMDGGENMPKPKNVYTYTVQCTRCEWILLLLSHIVFVLVPHKLAYFYTICLSICKRYVYRINIDNDNNSTQKYTGTLFKGHAASIPCASSPFCVSWNITMSPRVQRTACTHTLPRVIEL